MWGMWTKIRGFFLHPVGLGTIILVVSLVVSATLLGVREISYVYPGPAIAIAMLAIIALLVGIVLYGLWRVNFPRVRVLGLELLVDRWREFEPKERDSVILYEQFSIAQSIAQLDYRQDIRFIDYFAGFKIKGGAFLLQSGQNIPLVLKFDSLRKIVEETDRYERCVAGRLGQVPGEPRVPPQRYGKIEGVEWGAITYNLIRTGQIEHGRLQTFGEYYTRYNNTQQITTALNHIFAALRPWWTNDNWQNDNCAESRRNDLFGEYDRLTRKQDQMQQGIANACRVKQIEALQNITVNDRYINLSSDLRLRNPLNWVRDVFGAPQLAGWNNQQNLRRDSVVHGDFHSGNILISEDKHGQLMAWVIDFAHTHVGPTVQDIARLEADVKFGLVPDDVLNDLGTNGLYHFETNLLPEPQQPAPPLATLTPNQLPTEQQEIPQLQKARHAVCLLRDEGRRYTIGDDARPYYLALLHATLPMLYYRDRSPWQKCYAFISAALLCEWLRG